MRNTPTASGPQLSTRSPGDSESPRKRGAAVPEATKAGTTEPRAAESEAAEGGTPESEAYASTQLDLSFDELSDEWQIINDLGYIGHFLFVHVGGRSGKHRVLSYLYVSGGRRTQRQLVDHAGSTSAALSEVLAKLEAEGLVTRTRSEQDKRQLDVVLTAEGRNKAKEVIRWQQVFLGEAFSGFTAPEQKQLAALVGRLASHWYYIETNNVIEKQISEQKGA